MADQVKVSSPWKILGIMGLCVIGVTVMMSVFGSTLDTRAANRAQDQAEPQAAAPAPPPRTGPPYMELDRTVDHDATGEGFLNLYIRPIATDQQAVKAALQQAHDDFIGKRITGTDGNPVTRMWIYAYANEYARANNEAPIGVMTQLGADAAPTFDMLPQ